MFSNYGELSFFDRAIINFIKLYFIGSAFPRFTTYILSESSVLFFVENIKLLYNRRVEYFIFRGKYQVVVQSLNSPKFENLLLGDVEYLKVALHVEIKP